jgi:hypothetical protein
MPISATRKMPMFGRLARPGLVTISWMTVVRKIPIVMRVRDTAK